jgi:PAS domain S-box-containing protein
VVGDAGAAEMDELAAAGVCPNEELLADLALVSPDLLCAVSPEGVFLAVNAAWERLLGWTPEELVGRPFAEFLEDEFRVLTLAVWTRRVLRGEDVIDFENRFPCKDGSARWLSWSATLDADRGLVFCSGRDISGRVERFVELAAEAKLLSEAERVAGIGVWDWQVEEDVGYLSPGLCAIYGLEVGEGVAFGDIVDLVVVAEREAYERCVRDAVAAGTDFETEYRIRRPDGREAVVWERGNAVVVDGRTVRMFGTVKDVTEQRRTEGDLRRAADLERATAVKLRRIDQLKTSFLSAISHELRTPLAVISGAAETLRSAGDRMDPARRHELEDALVRNTRRFTSLLTDLLDVDRRSRGIDLTPEPIDLVALVRDVASRSARPERVELATPPTLVALVDALQTERIVANLLENADKYAPTGSVRVSLEPCGEVGFRLVVADEGPGVDPADLERLFDPFYRTERGQEQPGTGIGLALVDAFASLQRGRVWAERREPHGTAFVVEIPGPDGPSVPDGHLAYHRRPSPTA